MLSCAYPSEREAPRHLKSQGNKDLSNKPKKTKPTTSLNSPREDRGVGELAKGEGDKGQATAEEEAEEETNRTP